MTGPQPGTKAQSTGVIAAVAVGPRSASWTWQQTGPECLAAARAAVRGALARWSLATVADDVTLMASELVANACVHGATPVTLRLQLRHDPAGAELACEVTDAGPGMPEPAAASQEDEHGRGLAVVAALADESGVRSRQPGTAAWFRVAVAASARRAAGEGRAA